jgi:cell division septum initiation protein DivIVA
MTIKDYVDELEQIQSEIKRNNIRNAQLRKRVKELETSIFEYLSEKGQHGLKYKGRAIMLQEKERRPTKKKKDREAGIISLLEELGVSEPTAAYSKLQDVQKGSPVAETKLTFKKLPKI